MAAIGDSGAQVHHDLAAFIGGCRDEQLLIQRCQSCEDHVWPPRSHCPRCHRTRFDLVDVRGPAELYSWVVIDRGSPPSHADRVPYTLAIVQLRDNPRVRFVGELLIRSMEQPLQVGMALEPVFRDGELPAWGLSTG